MSHDYPPYLIGGIIKSMSYIYDVLDDIPIAFYLFDDSSSGTPNTDLYDIPINPTYVATPVSYIADISGYNRYASSTFDANSNVYPMISGVTSGVKASSTDQIMYPAMPIWGQNQNNYEFSVEFWLYDYGISEACTIFAPTDADGPLVNVGIFYEDGRIKFSVGDATGLAAPENYISVSHQLIDRYKVHHVVCVYGKTGVSISVDGGKYFEKEEQLVTQNIWTHTLTGFITSVPDSSGIAIAGLAVYQSRLPDKSISSHFLTGTEHMEFDEITTSMNGNGFRVNNSDSTETLLYKQPLSNGMWETLEEDNLLNDAGYLTLKEIEPGQLSDDTPVYNSGSLELQTNQYLVINNFHNHSGKSEGGISGTFYFDTAIHDNINEYCLFAVMSDDDSVSVIKNSSGEIVLRHRYTDELTFDEVTVDTVYGSVTYDAWCPVALFWSYGVFTLYCNNFSSPVQYQDSSSKQFSMSQANTMTVGSLDGELPAFESKLKYINVYDSIPDLASMTALIESTVNYSLKLTDDTTNVYQEGFAKIYVNTSGVDESTQIRANYGPVCGDVKVYSSIDDINYYLIEDSRQPIVFSNGSVLSDTTNEIFFKVILSTDDSFFRVPTLRYLEFSTYSDSSMYNNQSGSILTPNGLFTTGLYDDNILLKSLNNGITLLTDGASSGYITIDGISDNEQIADDNRTLPSGTQQEINTIEFFIKQNEVEPATEFKYLDYNNGDYCLSWDGSQITISGFTECYINKEVLGSGNSFGIGEWNHVVLVMPNNSGTLRVNEFSNPRLQVNDTGFIARSETTGSRSTTVDAASSGYPYEMLCVGTSTTGYGFETDPALVSASAGDSMVVSVSLIAENQPRAATVSIVFYDASVSEISSYSETYSDFTNYSLFAVKSTAPALTEHVSLKVEYESGIPDGELHYASNILIEKSSTVYPYFDGSSESTYEWEGTADASRSLYGLGLDIDTESLYIGSGSTHTTFATECSYKNIIFYPSNFDLNDVVRQYGLHANKNAISITDGGVSMLEEIYSLPIEISPVYEDGHPKIEDIDPLAIATSWTIHAS